MTNVLDTVNELIGMNVLKIVSELNYKGDR